MEETSKFMAKFKWGEKIVIVVEFIVNMIVI
jgi:hypothetical protein